MDGTMNTQKPELVETGLHSEARAKFAEHNMASGKDAMPFDLASSKSNSKGATSSIPKGVTKQDLGAEQGVCYPPTSAYNYYYPGYTGESNQFVDGGYFNPDGSYTGIPSENGSMVYYMPGYSPYGSGNHMGVDGQFVGQQPYSSGSDYTSFANSKSMYHKGSKFPSSNFSKSTHDNQPHKSSNKVSYLGSDISGGSMNGFNQGMKFPYYPNQSSFLHNGAMNYRQNSRTWNGKESRNKLKEKMNGIGEFESASELTCGPRANIQTATPNLPGQKEELGFAVRRDQYNLQDFQTEYDNAKFYVIKSYNEDNIHRCVKYGVWSSTPNGNKKLEGAFRLSESKAAETGKPCPVFLFFSVNGSGQFVGLAEMIGPVDFNKDMDFWQLDKWSGFFPVKWHIIKDIPNSQLRHIILENNENKPVTYTRDTQEVHLKQGLEMLKIFKTYNEKMSILDDFRFYESREKSNIVKRSPKPTSSEMDMYQNANFANQSEDDSGIMNQTLDPTASLISLTKNLSLI